MTALAPSPILPVRVEREVIQGGVMDGKKTIGVYIRELRESQDMTLTELARRAGISIPHLSRVERGHAEPSFMVVAKLARGLNMTVAELMRRIELATKIEQEQQ